MDIDEKRIQERLKQAWAALSAEEKDRYRPLIDEADSYLSTPEKIGLAESNKTAPHEMIMVKKFLDNKPDDHTEKMMPLIEQAIEIRVDKGGHIFGTGKYQVLDIRWVEAIAIYFENRLIRKFDFPVGTPSVIPIPDNAKIIMVGDWGTGNFGNTDSPSIKMVASIKSQSPDYTIHLGDVYYAGTTKEEVDHLVEIWPRGANGAFGLNSNHEMYSGAHAYFTEALGKLFLEQKGHSYFALENIHWIIVGLDSAYFDKSLLCRAGSIVGDLQLQQLEFLKAQVAKGKKLIVLTHHNGLIDMKDGSQQKNNPLWEQVMSAFPQGKGPDYWYWGHLHNGTAYQQNGDNNNVHCRCLGHGGIPGGYSAVLQKAKDNTSVVWFEDNKANDADNKFRIMNGFVTVVLNDEKITETYYDENGKVSWTL